MKLDEVMPAGAVVHTRDTIDHAVRARTVGGSDAGVILGLSPWQTPVQLWQEKRGAAPTRVVNDAMRMGTLLEPVIRGLYAERFPESTLCGKAYVIGREHWITANLDDFAFDPDVPNGTVTNRRVVEYKKVSPYSADKWGDEGTPFVPHIYVAQVTWYCGITGAEFADIGALIGDEFKCYRVPFDPDVFEFMVERAREFMRCVDLGIPPLWHNEDDVGRLFPASTGTTVVAGPGMLNDVLRLRALEQQQTAIDSERDLLRARVKAAIGECDTLALPNGDILATWRSQNRESLDVKALRKDHPEIAAQYMRHTSPRIFLLKQPKGDA